MNDGGPAFPITWHPEMRFAPQDIPHGMSLRDYFAGQALAGLLAANDHDENTSTELTKGAYKIANAMLTEREKEGE